LREHLLCALNLSGKNHRLPHAVTLTAVSVSHEWCRLADFLPFTITAEEAVCIKVFAIPSLRDSDAVRRHLFEGYRRPFFEENDTSTSRCVPKNTYAPPPVLVDPYLLIRTW
jgi:hypothetical protein